MPVFLSNLFLFFSLAALIPVALHLLHRRNPRPVWFAAMRFLEEAVARTRRARRLTQCLALLFRVLLLLLLALAFARPLVRWRGALPGGGRTLVLVVDSSASMQALDGGASRFAIAVDAARAVLRGGSEGDRVALLAPGSAEPEVVFPPVSLHRRVEEELRRLQPGWGRAGLLSFLDGALRREGLGGMSGAEVFVFSDFQENDCGLDAAPRLAETLRRLRGVLYLNRAGAAGTGANCGLEEVRFLPPAVLGDGAFRVRVKAARNAAFRDSCIARLRIGAREIDQQVLASGDAAGQVGGELTAPPATYGEGNVTGSVELEPDVFAGDNSFHFSLPHLQSRRAVVVCGEGPRDSFYLERAVAPGGDAVGLLRLERRSWEEFLAGDFSDCAYLFLCNPGELAGPALEKLSLCLRKGGTALIFPGERTALPSGPDALARFWPGLTASLQAYPAAARLDVLENDRREPLVRSVARKLRSPGGILVRRRLRLQAGAGQGVPWLWEDGGAFALPAVLGRGRLWLFSVSANRDWSDWPVAPFFLVLVQELIKGSAEQAAPLCQGEVGSPFRFVWPSPGLDARLRLTDPAGRRKPLALSRKSPDDRFRTPPLRRPGIHEIRGGDAPPLRFAVNIPASEKDLRTLPDDRLADRLPGDTAVSSDRDQLLAQVARRRQGRPLWPSLLLAAWLLGAGEVLFANLRSAGPTAPTVPRRRTP